MSQKNWREVKEAIECEIDRIWWEEPIEIKMSRLRIFPSGAGTDDQTLGNLFFLAADTRALGFWTVGPTMQRVIEDPTFTLEHCKRIWKYTTLHMVAFLGGGTAENPASYLNLPKLYQYCQDILNSLDTIKTKQEFESLLWSWGNYVNALHKWLFLVFPWELGRVFPRVDINDVKELAELYGKKIVEGQVLS